MYWLLAAFLMSCTSMFVRHLSVCNNTHLSYLGSFFNFAFSHFLYYQGLCTLRWLRTCCCQYFRTKTVILWDTMSYTPYPTQPTPWLAGLHILLSWILRSSWRSSSSLQVSSTFSRPVSEWNTRTWGMWHEYLTAIIVVSQ